MRARRYATGRTVMALILREMSTRYGRSPGGYIWAVIEPLGVIMLIAYGFSLLLHSPSLGTSFILFYATGYLPFTLYTQVSTMVARSLQFSRPLLFYPSVTWLDSLIARFLLNTLTGVMVAYILLTGILITTETRTVIDIMPVIVAMGLAALLGLGIGTLNCFMFGILPVWDLIWGILTRPLFLASGVIMTYENLPQSAQNILWYNPLIHITGIMREGFYPMYSPIYVSPLLVIIIALVPLALGMLLLRRHHKAILSQL